MRSRLRLLVYPVLFLVAACGNEVGPPHPDPLPDVTRARASALMGPPLGTGSGDISVVGLPGCVSGKGLVTIETLGKSYTGSSTEQGTFSMSVSSKIGEQLAIHFNTSQPGFKTVQEIGVQAPQPPQPIPGVPPLTPLAGGQVEVQGRTVAGAGRPVFGMNLRTIEIVEATSTTGGDFQLVLTATSGDALEIYDDTDPLGVPWPLTVP